ncbi:uncharacterized protein LOC114263032 [Camellia sinensis]|uniref:uncharacterized protein LOC114263032 n=1 Tax=Camellia sinensis TaxID=4442 RepID=UPI001035B18F|nr:uncharacterized protein LOC114263032 [Camellia sinensis]
MGFGQIKSDYLMEEFRCFEVCLMKIMSWNVRGLSRPEKMSKIRNMLKERGVDVVLIQETRRRTLEVTLIKSIWPFDKMDYMGVDADGRAGGLLCIWHPARFKVVDCCGSRNFIILSGISGQSFECFVVNVYASNDVGKRRQLWKSLKNLKISYPNPWCMGGDFNEIRFLGERKGCSRRDRGMNDFNELIDQLNLVDLPMKGRRFTWCNAQDGKR